MGEPPIAPKLCFVGVSGVCDVARLCRLATAAVRGGAELVCYQPGSATARCALDEAAELIAVTRRAGVPLIIGERVDVALGVTAEGVSVGPDGLPPAIARRPLGPRGAVGVAVGGMADVGEARRQGADYVVVGPLFGGPAGPAEALPKLELLAQAVAAREIPVCAYGGINLGNAAAVRGTGCAVVAVGRAIAEAPDPAQAARDLVALLRSP